MFFLICPVLINLKSIFIDALLHSRINMRRKCWDSLEILEGIAGGERLIERNLDLNGDTVVQAESGFM